MKSKLQLALLLPLALQAACVPSQDLGWEGDYQGFLTRSLDSRKIEQTAVRARVQGSPQGQSSIEVLPADPGSADSSLLQVELSPLQGSSPTLSIAGVTSSPITLKPDGDCLINSDQEAISVSLCLARDEISLELRGVGSAPTLISLTLDRFNPQVPPDLEKPKTYSRGEMVDLSFSRSFDTLAQFERTLQSRSKAKNAWLNLLPHLSNSSLTALAQGPLSVPGVIGVIGDLAPFLLPSRWAEAKSQASLSQAEEDALLLMRADGASEALSLANAVIRDSAVLDSYDRTLVDLDNLIRKVVSREVLGEFPAGTSDQLSTSRSTLAQDRLQLALALHEEKAALSQSLGFLNPEAVSGVSDAPLVSNPDAEAGALADDQVGATVLARSIELRQMDFLIQAAREQRKGIVFQWMDPAGDPTAGLGFGLGESLNVSKAQIAELQIKRSQLQALVLQRAQSALETRKTANSRLTEARDSVVIQERRLKRILINLEFSNTQNLLDLQTVLQDRLAAELGVLNAESAVSNAVSTLDRLLLRGPFARLSLGRGH